MDLTRIESFLDDGWSVIGQLHLWLSKWPDAAYERSTLDHLIKNLQGLWSSSEDLGAKRHARTILALELLLERFCAQTLEFDANRLSDFTIGVECLQDLLLGFEATREETEIIHPNALMRLEKHSKQPNWVNATSTITQFPSSLKFASTGNLTEVIQSEVEITANVDLSPCDSSPEVGDLRDTREGAPAAHDLLELLEQFVIKLDDTCRRLHARMVADEVAYVTTTSRLEHLARSTRELVAQITGHARITTPVDLEDSMRSSELSSTFEDPPQVMLMQPALSMTDSLTDETELLQQTIETSEERFSIADFLSSPSEPEVVESNLDSKRILIVEGSLFYRQLISMAVQSAGYEPETADSVGAGVDILDQSREFRAILIGSVVSPAMAEILEHCRRDQGIIVIALTSSNAEPNHSTDVDDHVEKSHPQKLLAILAQHLNCPSGVSRKSA